MVGFNVEADPRMDYTPEEARDIEIINICETLDVGWDKGEQIYEAELQKRRETAVTAEEEFLKELPF